MKALLLRNEDYKLLLELHTFVYLHRQFIEKHIYNNYAGHHSVLRRLRALEEAGFIKSWFLQINDSDTRTSKVYTLARAGVEQVEELRGLVHWSTEWTAKPARWYRHQLLIAEAVKSYELQAENHGLELKEFITEPRAFFEYPAASHANKKKTSIRPDGCLVLGPPGGAAFGFFIEMERSYSSKEVTLRKVDQYNEFFSRHEELMANYQRKVAFEQAVDSFKIIFIGGTQAKTEKLLKELHGESSLVPIVVAAHEDVLVNPYGAIYRDSRDPENYITL